MPGSTAVSSNIRYRVVSVLGEGGYGRVYRGRLEGMGSFTKDVALKILHDLNPPEEVLARFRDEARILGLLSDRAVVRVEPPMLLGHQWALVMEFVDGVSLSSVVKRGKVPPGVALDVIEEVARTLDNVWKQPGPDGRPLHLMHRDLKPANIKITPTGDVRILDFGLARADFEAREAQTKLHVGGTLGYLAPERFTGEDSNVSDVFSLGVVLHELLTGERPKFTSNPMKGIEALAPGDEPLLRVLRLAAKMRATEPADRPSAREVERQCQLLRGLTPRPHLRDWAEKLTSEAEGEPLSDPLVGMVLSQTDATMDTPLRGRRGPIDWARGASLLAWGLCVAGLLGAVVVSLALGALDAGLCVAIGAAAGLVSVSLSAGIAATLLGRTDRRHVDAALSGPMIVRPHPRISGQAKDSSSTLGVKILDSSERPAPPRQPGPLASALGTPPTSDQTDDEDEKLTRIMPPRDFSDLGRK